MRTDTICDVPGIMVGHAQNNTAKTGCTVIIPDCPAVTGVDVRGSAPGSREIELLYPTRLVPAVNAILLTGGSAFGLDAAGGVQQFLEEKGIGYDTGAARVPIVPAAVIFDLAVGNPKVRPGKAMGYKAASRAGYNEISQGSIGVGTGATVGKLAGFQNAMKGGIGTASSLLDKGIVVGVIIVVNALGNIIDPVTNETIAGARNPDDNSFYDPMALLKQPALIPNEMLTNTTLGVVATNASLNKEEVTKIAQMAHDGFARAIYPAHTQYDGDIIFMLATGTGQKFDPLLIGAVAAELTAKAIIKGVQAAF